MNKFLSRVAMTFLLFGIVDKSNSQTATLVKDINPGTASSIDGAATFSVVDGNTVYFVASDNGTNYELWKTDGTTGGTIKISNTQATTSALGQWWSLNGKFIFSMYDGNNSYGRELWTTDGTLAGTTLLKDINPGTASSIDGAATFSIVAGNTMYFVATDNGTNYELWKTDGTTAGTIKISNTQATTSALGQWWSVNSKFIFSMYDGNNIRGRELWTTDGTLAGTTLLKDINPGTASSIDGAATFSIVSGNTMYFVATGNTTNYELWKTDGTTAGTIKISNTQATTSALGQWWSVNSKFIFSMYDGNNIRGRELWTTDGTLAGTTLLKDINPGTASSIDGSATFSTASGNTMYFVASDKVTNYELWKTDGTTTGTIKISNTQATTSALGQWWSVNSKFIFSMYDGNNIRGRELWTIVNTTNLEDFFAESTEMKIYPNPAADIIAIALNTRIAELTIYSGVGQLVKKIMVNNAFNENIAVDVSGFKNGIYFIEARSQNGELRTRKFIKQD